MSIIEPLEGGALERLLLQRRRPLVQLPREVGNGVLIPFDFLEELLLHLHPLVELVLHCPSLRFSPFFEAWDLLVCFLFNCSKLVLLLQDLVLIHGCGDQLLVRLRLYFFGGVSREELRLAFIIFYNAIFILDVFCQGFVVICDYILRWQQSLYLHVLLLHSLVLVIQLPHAVVKHFLGLKELVFNSCECILHHFELVLLLLALLVSNFGFVF